MQDIVAVIPARSGSKSVPNKNVKRLAGIPLLAYSIATARLVENVERIIVSTDSEQYSKIAREYGAEAPFLRPPEISNDRSSDYEWIRHLLDWLQDCEGYMPRYLVHLRPTTPLRDANTIDAAIKYFKDHDELTALRSVHAMPESSYKTFEIESDGCLKSFGSASFDLDDANRPRQEFPETYNANGYVDIVRTSHVLANEKIHGNRVAAFVTEPVVEVDTMNEFLYLEFLVAKDPTLVDKLFDQYTT